MPAAKKMNIASYRVLKTLLCLFHNNLTMSELVAELESDGYGPYNNYIVSKYIHTLRACGIDIQKLNKRYCIINFPLGMKFSNLDTQLLYDIKSVGSKIALDNISYTIEKFFDKIHLSFYKSGTGVLSSHNFNVIKNLEYAYKTNAEVVITFVDDHKEKFFLRDIKINNGKYFFIAANEGGTFDIDPEKIYNVELLNKKTKIDYSNSGVTYELYGSLAERYQLRENERIIKYKDDGTIVILNEYEDRTVLIHRLLRYDSLCKVIGPSDFLKKFKDVINESLENYNIDSSRKSQKLLAKEVTKQKEKIKKVKKENERNR